MAQHLVVLLRGINVGGRNKLKMADLRDIAAGCGYADAVTHLQSGNLVLPSVADKPAVVATTLAAAITKASKLEVPIIVRTAKQWQAVINANPYPNRATTEPASVHTIFLPGKATAAVQAFDPGRYEPDTCTVTTNEVYLSLPTGMSRTKLYPALVRLDNASAGTARNWRTVAALAEKLASL